MYFKQIAVGSMGNFSYLFGCKNTREAGIVDPAFNVSNIIKQAKDDGYKINYVFTTHSHFDHVGGHKDIIEQTGAKVAVHSLESDNLRRNNIPSDIIVEDGSEVQVGELKVEIIHTPGHTPGGICLLINGKKLITGDTLFVGDCGRTDLAGGSSKALYDSISNKLKILDDKIEIYPGHNYGHKPSSTIGEEKKLNPTMKCKSLEEFDALP